MASTMSKQARFLGVVVCLSGIALSATTVHAATTLRLAHTFNPGEASYELFSQLPQLIEERTEGELRIQVFPSEQLGSEVQLLQQASNGSVDIVVPGYSGASTLVPALEISNAPFIFESWEEARHILEGEAYQPIFEELEGQYGLQPLAKSWYWGWRNFTFKGANVETLDDLAGLKIRVPESPAWVEMINAFGASPTPIPFSEVYLALQQGTVDGQENPIPTIYARKFFEVQDQLVMSRHMLQSQVVLINSNRFNSLDSDLQEALREVMVQLADENYILQSAREEEMLQSMKDSGLIEVVDNIDRTAFEQAAQNAYENLTSRWGEEHLKRVLDAIDSYRQEG